MLLNLAAVCESHSSAFSFLTTDDNRNRRSNECVTSDAAAQLTMILVPFSDIAGLIRADTNLLFDGLN